MVACINDMDDARLARIISAKSRDPDAKRWVLEHLRGRGRFIDLITAIFERNTWKNTGDVKTQAVTMVFEALEPDADPGELYDAFFDNLDGPWIGVTFGLTARTYNQPPPEDRMEDMSGELYGTVMNAMEPYLNKRQRDYLRNLRGW